jgi:hypothetical protein
MIKNYKYASTYKINKYISAGNHPIFLLLKKYYKYPFEYTYTCKINECTIQLSQELEDDVEIKKLLKEYDFIKVE